MTPPMKHSPLPWGIARLFVLDASNGRVCEMTGYGTGEDDAVFILHAVNNIERVEAELSRVKEVNEKLVFALDWMLRHYVGLVNSGDAGFWDADNEACVIKARSALAEAAKMKGDL